ncbi:hypothetical protein [Gemella sp. zg-1178]|uniref:hypothetical protein n=1 Tax=Gemella sp. zg-1178 TaxID=2840372 RepID=UPI001C053BF6|nr:hypothetical protein [Gemella sp. zg-1178]MBU0279119.1 hypothetical protein [Gemella sp. zg-1178]
MRKHKKFLSAILASSLLVTPISALVSNYNNVAKAEKLPSSIDENYIIKKLDKYVKFNKDKKIFEFDKDKNLSLEELNFLESKISETNKRLNNLIISDNEQIKYLSKKVKVISTPNLKEGAYLRYAEGIDAIDFYWWGMDIWLSKTTLNKAVATGTIIAGVFISSARILAALQILGVWAPVPGGIYMKVHYPFGIAEVRWHG